MSRYVSSIVLWKIRLIYCCLFVSLIARLLVRMNEVSQFCNNTQMQGQEERERHKYF